MRAIPSASAVGPDGAQAQECAVARRLLTAANLLTRFADSVAGECGLTTARWLMLGAVCRCGEPPTVGELSEDALLSAQNVSRMAAAMEEEGLLERFTRPGSGRSVFVRPTPAGRAALERTSGMAERVRGRMLEGLSDAEAALVERALGVVIDNLRRLDHPRPGAAGAGE